MHSAGAGLPAEAGARRGQAKAGFVLDLGRCVGCSACVLACRLENAHRSSAPLRRVLPLNETRHSGGPTWFLSLACHHCERPACVRACPSGAYARRADGVVTHNQALCIGCRYCEMACPFGAPQFEAATGVMAKCDFCQARVAEGAAPACVAACPTEALKESGLNSPHESIPGFVDAAACRPAINFRLPRGIRGRRLQQLLEREPGRATSDKRRATSDQRPTTGDQRPFAEWPLVIFTALAIPAAGVFAAHLLASLVSGAATPFDGAQRLAAIGLLAALVVSLFHLGRPLRAPFALRGTGRNALSTEVALASALLILALLALLPSLSLALRLASARAAGVLGLALLAALGLVYFLPGHWPWRTLLVASPMTSGLAVGFVVLACGAVPPFPLAVPLAMFLIDGAVGCLAYQPSRPSHRRLPRRSSSLHDPTSEGGRFGLASLPDLPDHAFAPVYPCIFARRRSLVALRLVLVNLVPATLLVAQRPILAASIATAGVFVDRFAFYGLAAVQSTEAAMAAVEQRIARG